ncbi:MAG: sensor histidine kinase [Acidimicrobiales bacterium]
MGGRPVLAPQNWMHLPRRTVRLRLTALYGALFLASGAALLAITYGLLSGQKVPASFNVLRTGNEGLQAVVAKAPTRVALVRFATCMRAHGVEVHTLLTADGGAFQIHAPKPNSKAYLAAIGACEPPFHANLALPRMTVSYPSRTATLSRLGPPMVVEGGVEAVLPTQGELDRLLVESAIALAIMAVVSIGLGWVMAGRALRPLRAMTTSARHISEENLQERLAVNGPADEMKDLGDTINGLLGRLETAFEGQRRFVANASHELRTPLAMMRTSLDVALAKPNPTPDVRALAPKLEEGLDQANRLLDGLLMLARVQRGALGELGGVPLDVLVAEALGANSAEIARRGLTVENTTAPAVAWGNETLLARLVFNLVDNAVRHNVPGGVVQVSNGCDSAMARLAIANSGPVIEHAKLAELGEPFRRLGGERMGNADGSGLGLSIAKAIALAHGGSLRLHARPGGGLVTVTTLPLRPT